MRRVKSLIDLPLTAKLGHKIQNPALHLFRVTGFLGNHRPFLILFSLSGLKEEIWVGNTTDCCLYLTLPKVNGNWGLDSEYSILDT